MSARIYEDILPEIGVGRPKGMRSANISRQEASFCQLCTETVEASMWDIGIWKGTVRYYSNSFSYLTYIGALCK